MLVLRDTDLDAVAVTYTATAYQHDVLYEGVPITVPVERGARLGLL